VQSNDLKLKALHSQLGANAINNYVCKCIAIETFTFVDNAVIRNFLFAKKLSDVNLDKKSLVDNIGPWLGITLSSGAQSYKTFCALERWKLKCLKWYFYPYKKSNEYFPKIQNVFY
jgi:hypothetical protein